MDLSGFTVSEAAIGRRMGAPRKVLREAREGLAEGVDWAVAGGEVRLTAVAGEVLIKRVGVHESFDVEGLVRACSVGQEDALTKVLRVEARTRNRHIIMAWVDDPTPGAELVRVQVPDSKNFVAGQSIRAVHVEEDLWELTSRCPRSRRDWMRDEEAT